MWKIFLVFRCISKINLVFLSFTSVLFGIDNVLVFNIFGVFAVAVNFIDSGFDIHLQLYLKDIMQLTNSNRLSWDEYDELTPS